MKVYKFITIYQDRDPYLLELGKRPIFRVVNNKQAKELGSIYYYSPWRQYVFAPLSTSVYNKSCLQDIINFIEEI